MAMIPKIFKEKIDGSLEKLNAILERKEPKVLFFTENDFLFPEDFDKDFGRSSYEFVISYSQSIFDNQNFDFDIVILCGHLKSEEILAWKLQNMPRRPFVALWAWDNHHEPILNSRAAMIADAVFPAHWFAHEDMANAATLIAPHLPLCITQWSSVFLASMEERIVAAGRCDKLYGGFFNHADARERNGLIASYRERYPNEHVFTLPLDKRPAYFSFSQEQRLLDWASYKVSVILPLRNDISQRLFDALACGLIPIVPPEFPDLDLVFSRHDQHFLPIVRMESYSVEGIADAHTRALKLFDRDGKQGVVRRHRFARDNHGLRNRIDRLVSLFRPGTAFSKVRIDFENGIHIYLT
ncbi:hypothetical protein GBZ48_08685 [Azospirillum melinis]|uniref:Glycosyltransferase family 1 protein n=1 Tax=Azospirillum melinis TaxID=328839 RepID=A0ABX2KDA4_9PROT|nr:hypothetical protein [Azospirillum melinis]MBP2308903.1 hypothetical protein [Azospirillum melinis]NUA99365.1 hypothetical protein [Azospirillum melinis]